ncbi:MAG: ATP phosphoribosyltransferase [Myxococcota bacterium]
MPDLRLALPKGRIEPAVLALLADAGLPVTRGPRAYRPRVALADVDAKVLKPRTVVEMLHAGTRDLGFAGADWVAELDADLVEVLDTGLDPVRVVAAAPSALVAAGWPPDRPVVVASEYERLARRWIDRRGLTARVVRTSGATEVFPPDDADCIVDNTATGGTLTANGLEVVDEVLRSTTRLYASLAAMRDPGRRQRIEAVALLLRSVLDARGRVMLEVNVAPGALGAVVDALPCMRRPTVSPLYGDEGYAVKAAVPRDALPELIPRVRALGGTDLVVTALAQIVPGGAR